MKKVLLLLLALTFSFTLAACNDNGGEDEERTAPVIEGVDDVTIYMNETFDPMDGVTATDHDGNDITEDIEVVGSVDTSSTGTEYLRYKVEDSEGLSSEAARYVTVEVDPDSLGDEMVPNGDFSLGMNLWNVTQGNEGGYGDFTVEDGELKAEITAVSATQWEPRLENNGIEFEKDAIYEVSFEARSVDPRAINVQVGELLDGAPWFADFKEGIVAKFDLSTTMESYSFQFIMEEDTNDNGSLLFEFGTSEHETTGLDNLFTTVYLDNVEINEIDEYTDTAAPLVLGADDTYITVGDAFDPLEGVTAEDNVDGEITLDSSNVTGTVDTDTVGEYVLTYTVSDEAGNEASHERTITVREEDTAPKTSGYGWRVHNDAVEASGEVVDGDFVLTANSINTSNSWDLQIIQDNTALNMLPSEEGPLTLEAGATYKVVFEAKASVAGTFNLAIGTGYGGWTGYHSDDTVSVDTTMQTIEVEFTLPSDGDFGAAAQLKFELGKLFEGAADGSTFTLDNVRLEKQDGTEFVDTEQVVNGTFTAENVIANGDFSDGMTGWSTTTGNEDGEANFNVVDEELEIEITGVSAATNPFEPRLEIEGVEFQEGITYEIAFDARALAPRAMQIQVGELFDGAPWFTDFKPDVPAVFHLSTDMETYTLNFTMNNETNMNGAVTFEFGTFEHETAGTDNLLTTVYLDNVRVYAVDNYEDTIKPNITGAEDTTITVGDAFDPLEGVSVSDNVDGSITLESAHVTGTVDTSTAGEYVLTYTVSDEAGNETVVERTITVEEETTVTDPLPTTADHGWRTFVEGPTVETEVIDGEYVFEASSIPETLDAYKLQVIQDAFALGTGADNEGSMTFEAGATYRVTFDAKASVAGNVNINIGYTNPDYSFTFYDQQSDFALTTSMDTYTYEFTLDDDTMDYTTPAQFKFELGKLFENQADGSTFTLDNVKIEKHDGTNFVETDLIENGTFTAENILSNGDFSDGMTGYTTTTDNEGGKGTFTVENGELKIDITAVSPTQWEPRLENNNNQFINGVIYEISFDARALAPRAMHIQVGELLDDAPWFDDFKPTDVAKFDLSTTMETYSFNFVMNKETNNNGSVTFEFGTADHATAGTDNLLTTVYLDNIKVYAVNEYEDTTPPMFMGVEDQTININDAFDPLEGVTSTDNIDGAYTLDASHVSGTVDTSTTGTYTLTYSITDAAGNTKTVERVITVQEDPTLQADYGWRAFINDWEGGAATGSVVNEEYVYEITSVSAMNAGYKAQVIQDAQALGTGGENEGSLSLETGATYRLTFDAKASVDGDASVLIGHTGGGWTQYFGNTASLTSTMTSYSYEFTLDDTNLDYSTPAQFKFELGNLFNGAADGSTFTLDNVLIEKDDNGTWVDANQIVNGDFAN